MFKCALGEESSNPRFNTPILRNSLHEDAMFLCMVVAERNYQGAAQANTGVESVSETKETTISEECWGVWLPQKIKVLTVLKEYLYLRRYRCRIWDSRGNQD